MEGGTVQIQMRQRADDCERFSATAFQDQIGTTVNLKTSVGLLADCALILDAEVAKDGSYVDLVFEFPYTVAALIWSGLVS